MFEEDTALSSHYYTPKPEGEHQYREIYYDYADRTLSLKTDTNVFSKERVDFGSSLLIQSMEILASDTVLDVGCGYGIMGICAALRAVNGEVVMVDINQRAIELAQENIQRNGITNARAIVSDIYDQITREEKFDVILSNPPIRAGKEVVYNIFTEAYPRLKSGGSLWIVIQKKQGAESAEKKLREIFPNVDLIRKEKGYRIYRAKK